MGRPKDWGCLKCKRNLTQFAFSFCIKMMINEINQDDDYVTNHFKN